MQILQIVPCFDMSDTAGKKSFRSLAEFILVNRQLDLSCDIVNSLVRHMFTYIWPFPQDNDDALSAICDITSSMVHKAINPNATMLLVNETISIANAISADANGCTEQQEVDEETLLRCMMIISATLKTNRYRVMNAVLRGLLENLIEKGVVCVNSDCRILAFEAMGIIAMYDERIAFEKVILIKDTLEVDEDLKPTSLNILCNMCLLHGYENVAKWFAGSSMDFGDPKNSLIKVFLEFVNDRNDETSFTACECLCKLLLNETDTDWTNVLATLFLKAFDPHTEKNGRLKACLVAFIPTYAESDRLHQLLLVEAFTEIFDRLRNANREQSIAFKKLSVIASCLVSATSKQSCSLQSKPEKSVHPFLCEKILDAIEADPDGESKFVSVYCMMLSQLEVSEWDDLDELHSIKERTEEMIDLLRAMEVRAQDVRLIVALSKSLSKRIETVENFSERRRSRTSSIADELVGLTQQLRLETPIRKQPHTQATSAQACCQTFMRTIPDSKAGSSSTARRPPRLPKAGRRQDLKKVLMEQNGDLDAENASVMTLFTTPASAPRGRPILQRAAKTPAASKFYKDDLMIEEVDEEPEL
ncbi:Condensin complex subunit 3 [Toxocara canis]|uniref:Condensin complex subunit 3 n=1 Tax=Toxocara canis TaxID=6265 RepID=A0A0B2VJG8_TOXCA|nr:Condensin complex subunit 3 [Toxocara canis]